MLKNMTVGKRIFLGFILCLTLMVCLGLVAFNALKGTKEGFIHYRELARETNLAGRLQAHILMLRMEAKSFLINNNDKYLEKFQEYYKKTDEFNEQAGKQITEPTRAKLITEIDAKHNQYKDVFFEIVKKIKETKVLTESVLNAKGPLMEKMLTQMLNSAKEDSDPTNIYHVGLTLRSLLLARLYATKFLDTEDIKAAVRGREEFGKMQELMNALDKELKNPAQRDLLTQLSGLKG
ncbi:MAG: MCP four helix bundle domain-containing protein [Deltaproteobacteria bacterium]|nr:MCP four helix bundle domain-containing protein [Deltaproteobacteria bacterium]